MLVAPRRCKNIVRYCVKEGTYRRSDQTLIIAEAGVNHNGDLDMAMRMIEVAASAGAANRSVVRLKKTRRFVIGFSR